MKEEVMPNFFHGVEVVEVDSSFRDLQMTSSSVIGLIGTAPDAEGFPLNTPVLCVGDKSESLQKLGVPGMPIHKSSATPGHTLHLTLLPNCHTIHLR
jgi:phage tail sheath protein FI